MHSLSNLCEIVGMECYVRRELPGIQAFARWLPDVCQPPIIPVQQSSLLKHSGLAAGHTKFLSKKRIVMPSCVLAYSGGLDTSVILGWLQDEGYDVHCVYVDLGQPCEDRDAIMKKAHDNGAISARLIDVQEDLCRDFAFPVLQWQAKYEEVYLLGTSIARPLISKVCLDVAREVGADAYAHGATGKGNDQCRFQLAAEALEPSVKMIAPWRIAKFRELFPGRTEMLAYCEEKGIPVKASVSKPYSSDENCLHISYEAGDIEDLSVDGYEVIDFGMGVSPQEAPDEIETVTLGFESGVPVILNGQKKTALEMVTELNDIAGRNGIGRIDIIENRFVGMKSRGVYEAPGMTVLYSAHQLIEQLTLDRDLVHLRDRISPEVAEMVYYGFWYTPKMDALMAFCKETQKPVTGEVKLGLYKGNILVSERSSPNSLYDAEIASMEGGGSYNQDDAEGFLRIMGLPSRVQGRVNPREY
jgi:argininosuccinate synthase